jgi:hypothetical protein
VFVLWPSSGTALGGVLVVRSRWLRARGDGGVWERGETREKMGSGPKESPKYKIRGVISIQSFYTPENITKIGSIVQRWLEV